MSLIILHSLASKHFCYFFPSETRDVEGDDDASEDTDQNHESAALYGSLGFAYGGANDLLHSQFDLHTRAQKRDQIILLQVDSHVLWFY